MWRHSWMLYKKAKKIWIHRLLTITNFTLDLKAGKDRHPDFCVFILFYQIHIVYYLIRKWETYQPKLIVFSVEILQLFFDHRGLVHTSQLGPVTLQDVVQDRSFHLKKKYYHSGRSKIIFQCRGTPRSQFRQHFISAFAPKFLLQKSSNLKCKHKKVLRETFVRKSRA